jgi:hypothetical protein
MSLEEIDRYCSRRPEIAALVTIRGKGAHQVELHRFNFDSTSTPEIADPGE